MRQLRFLTIVVVPFFCCVTDAQQMTGNLQGRLVDSLEEPVVGANVFVTGPNIQGARNCVSDGLGYFNILSLPPGDISVKIVHPAYQPVTFEEVIIHLGKTTTLGETFLNFRIYDVPEVVVSGKRLAVDPITTSYGANLRSTDFESLPIQRNYKEMTSLLPQANASFYGDEVNIGGATGHENKYFVDGVEVTDPLLGTTGMNLPYNFVQEVEVKPGGYEAEFRSALGGIMNVVTRSGTNEIHGSLLSFYTSNRFEKNRRLGLFDPTQGSFSDYDIGFGIGGPIVRDELWFFISYNPTFARRDVDVPSFGKSVDKTLMHGFATKLTWSASQELRVIATVNGDPTERTSVGRGVSVAPSALSNRDPYFMDIKEGGINISLNASYSPEQNLLLETSIARVMRHDSGEPSTVRGDKEIFFNDLTNNVWSGGPESEWDSYRYSNMAKLTGTFLTKEHTIRSGLAYVINGVDNQYEVKGINKVDSANYYFYNRKGFGTVDQGIPSFFIQDSWQIFRSLRIHAGIRWENQSVVGSNGDVAQTVTSPLLPRLGLVFLPREDGSQKLFGSYGRYSQELSLFHGVNYFSDKGYWKVFHYAQDPRISKTGEDTIVYAPFTIQPEVQGLRFQLFDEFSLGYELSVWENFRVSVQGVYRTLREAIYDVWIPAENRGRLGNPGKGVLSGFPAAQRDYKALVFTIERREDEHFNFFASYVLSRNYGNYEGVFDSFLHNGFPNNKVTFDDFADARRNAVGLLANDRTHVFKFHGSYRFSFGLSTGLSFIAQSGTPLTEYAWTNIGVKFMAARGTAGKAPALWDINARMMYEIPFTDLWHTQIVFDVFHIISQRSPTDIDQFHYYIAPDGTKYPNTTYGQAFRYQQPMSVRAGIKVNF